MKPLLKHIASFILPFLVLVVVPNSIEDNWTWRNEIQSYAGMAFMLTGLITMSVTIASFITIGKGTLAPWSPTKKLVLNGLYRHVRNPMILGVFLVLLGEAMAFASLPILIWSGCFMIINTVYFILSEEPGLERRFGDEYRQYKKHVGRWWPRLTPYDPTTSLTQP